MFFWCWLSLIWSLLYCWFCLCRPRFLSKKTLKKHWKMLQKLDWYWNPLLEASWELLGLSWGALGPLLGTLGGPKWCPRGWGSLTQDSFFCNFVLHHIFFSIFAASWCLWCLSWEGFGPSGASLGSVFDPLGSSFSRIKENNGWIFGVFAPLCVYLLWLTRHMGTCPLTPCLIYWPGGMREAININTGTSNICFFDKFLILTLLFFENG